MNRPVGTYKRMCTVNHVDLTEKQTQKAEQAMGIVVKLMERQIKKIDAARTIPEPPPTARETISETPNTPSVSDALLRNGPRLPSLGQGTH